MHALAGKHPVDGRQKTGAPRVHPVRSPPGSRNLQAKTPAPACAPKPSTPGGPWAPARRSPGRPPGARIRHPASRYDVGNVLTTDGACTRPAHGWRGRAGWCGYGQGLREGDELDVEAAAPAGTSQMPLRTYPPGEAAGYKVLEEWTRLGLGSAMVPRSKAHLARRPAPAAAEPGP
ncbi:hypothetical protein GCM10023083_55290 [Streptomyces phyllanthi]